MEVSGITRSLLQYFCMMLKIKDSGQTLLTLQKHHQQVFSDGKQSFESHPIVLFGLLLHLDTTVLTCTVGSTGYKGHLQLKCLTAEQLANTTLLSYVLLTGCRTHSPGYDNDTVVEHNV